MWRAKKDFAVFAPLSEVNGLCGRDMIVPGTTSLPLQPLHYISYCSLTIENRVNNISVIVPSLPCSRPFLAFFVVSLHQLLPLHLMSVSQVMAFNSYSNQLVNTAQPPHPFETEHRKNAGKLKKSARAKKRFAICFTSVAHARLCSHKQCTQPPLESCFLPLKFAEDGWR